MKSVARRQTTEQKLFGGLRTSSSFAKASGGRRSSHSSSSEASGMALVLAVLADTSEGSRVIHMKPYIQERLRQMAVDAYGARENPARVHHRFAVVAEQPASYPDEEGPSKQDR